MYKFEKNVAATALLLLTLPLAGCAIDSFEDDQALQPYGGSKQHPIKVANGKAYVEGCGDWSENTADTADNQMSNNHGCAVQANIAALVAYPEDLAGKRKLAPPLGDVQYNAIQKITANPGGGSGGSSGSGSGGDSGSGSSKP